MICLELERLYFINHLIFKQYHLVRYIQISEGDSDLYVRNFRDLETNEVTSQNTELKNLK